MEDSKKQMIRCHNCGQCVSRSEPEESEISGQLLCGHCYEEEQLDQFLEEEW